MAGNSVFDPKNIVRMTTEKEGLLEELNLPPEAIKFIREYSTAIKIALVCLVAAILAWEGYGYYHEGQIEKSSALLAEAMQEKSPEQQVKDLDRVVQEYPRTDAAVWSRIEQGNIAYDDGRLDDAIKSYKQVLETVSSKNALVPLVQYSLAEAYEDKGEGEQAIAAYNRLAEFPGFAGEAYLALGRIYEAEGKPDKAKEVYQKIIDQGTLSGASLTMVENKLATL